MNHPYIIIIHEEHELQISCMTTRKINLISDFPFSFKKIIIMVYVKLLFTTLCFVGLYSMPNLIVMLFNLLYLIFIVGFHCKGCVLERENMKTQAIEDWRDFADSLWLSILWKEVCALHMTGMRRVRLDGDCCVSWISRG